MTKYVCIIFFFFLAGFKTQSQNIIGVVDYLKVENANEFLEVEKLWQKIEEERVKEGMTIGWSVYQVMFKTIDDPYNFISISWYDSFSKLDKKIPDEVLEAAYPEKNKADWKEFKQKVDNSRILINSGVFYQQLTCVNGLDRLGKYYVINEITVSPDDSKEYLQLSKDIFKPLFEEDIRNNNRTVWSLWAKWPGNDKDFQYLAADGYSSLDQIDHPKYMEYFSKIFPEKDFKGISARMDKLKKPVNTEMWKLVFRALK